MSPDKEPVKDTNKGGARSQKTQSTTDQKNVRFNLGGKGKGEFGNPDELRPRTQEVKPDELPNALKKQAALDELQERKKYLTIEDIASESKSNQHIIYKFMKKGFTALSAEELACTMVNPTFSIDFKKNAMEDWNLNYQSKVVEKLQRCKFHMHWFIKQANAGGYDDQHENFMKLVEIGDLEKVFMYMRKNEVAQVLQAVEKKSKRSPLHIAAKFGHLHLIEFFINKGANVEARDKLLKTPLHYACEAGNTLAVKMLMENGSDPFEKDNCGRTALHYSVYCGRTDIIALLTQHTTDIVHMKDHAGRTALHHAVFMEANQVLMISKLLDYGADVNALDSDRRTALHHAAESNKPRTIPILIQRGAHTSLKDSLLKKTPLELAANDHIKELIIAYCSPQYMPNEQELNSPGKRIHQEILVNKQGQIVKRKELDLEAPMKNRKRSQSKKKEVKIHEEPEVHQLPVAQPVMIEPQTCPNCDKMKGIGPVAEWASQEEKFIPYNMKNYQQRLFDLLRRIQRFGVESFVFQKKPYLYTGSWMEYVRDLDGLMLQINGVNPNEACMKVFNVLFPYPEPLPLGKGDESSLAGFFDGITKVDKAADLRDCLPEQLLENINNQKSGIADDAMKKNDVETVQDLLDIRQEVMQLRSANNALEFQIQQKDDLISKLRGDTDKWQREAEDGAAFDEKNEKLLAQNNKLQIQLNTLIEKNADLEDKCMTITEQLKFAQAAVEGSKITDVQEKMAEQIERLIDEKEKLAQKYQLVNERNKTLRHKAGQVFLQSIDAGATKTSVKSASGAGKLYLEDEEAITRMVKEIELQDRGDLKQRLKKVSFSDSGMIWQKNFVGLIKNELGMSDSDQIKLLRVSGFAALKTQDKSLKMDFVLKNIEDRIAQSSKLRDDCVKKIAKLMKDEGITLETAMLYFDTDGSGSISRNEFNEAFKEMKVTLNEALIKNCFVILDKNGDNSIDLIEFEAVFGKYMNAGGAVQEIEATDLVNDKIDAATAKDLAKQMNNEIKKTNVYTDAKLESMNQEDLDKIEEQRVMDIQAGGLPEKIIGGEIQVKVSQGQNFTEINGKPWFAFQYEMPQYDNTGKMKKPGYYQQIKAPDPESGGFKSKIKVKLPIKNQNMFMFQEMIKVSVYRCVEGETDFKEANKTFVGQFYIMWKECVERETNGESAWLNYEEELRDPEENCNVDLSGQFIGQAKWIKFGHKDSSYDANGEKREAKKAQKTAADFKGRQIGEAGTLEICTKKYVHPIELSLDTKYQVSYQLKKEDGSLVGETLSLPTNNEMSAQNPKEFKWSDVKEVAMNDRKEDLYLYIKVQTEQHGITPGQPIASGMVNLNESLYTAKKDAKGQFRQQFNVTLKLADDETQTSQFTILLKQRPIAGAPQPVAAAKPASLKQSSQQSNNQPSQNSNNSQQFAIPNDDLDEDFENE